MKPGSAKSNEFRIKNTTNTKLNKNPSLRHRTSGSKKLIDPEISSLQDKLFNNLLGNSNSSDTKLFDLNNLMPINSVDPLAEKYQIHNTKTVDYNDPFDRKSNIEQITRDTLARMKPKPKKKVKKKSKKKVKKTGQLDPMEVNTFFTGAGLYNDEEEVEYSEEIEVDDETADKVPPLPEHMLMQDNDHLLDDLKNDLLKKSQNNEDDLAWIRRKLKEVGKGIKSNASDLKPVLKSFSGMNTSLKQLGIGFSDDLFDEMEHLMKVAESKNPYAAKTSVNAHWNADDLEENEYWLNYKG